MNKTTVGRIIVAAFFYLTAILVFDAPYWAAYMGGMIFCYMVLPARC